MKNICVAVVALASITVVVLGVLALLSNHKLIALQGFSVKNPGDIAMIATGGAVTTILAFLIIRSCCRSRRKDPSSGATGGSMFSSITGNTGSPGTPSSSTFTLVPGLRNNQN